MLGGLVALSWPLLTSQFDLSTLTILAGTLILTLGLLHVFGGFPAGSILGRRRDWGSLDPWFARDRPWHCCIGITRQINGRDYRSEYFLLCHFWPCPSLRSVPALETWFRGGLVSNRPEHQAAGR